MLFETSGAGAVIAVRLNDGKQARLVDLKNFVITGRYGFSLAVAPDGSPLLLRSVGTQDIYSLDLETP